VDAGAIDHDERVTARAFSDCALGELRLQRCKEKASGRIAFERKADGAVAQVAEAVEEDDRKRCAVRIAVDDAVLDVLDEGQGTAVVLLHAFPLAKESWDAQAAFLSTHARVIRPDLRGLGRSSAPPGPYLIERLAADVAAVLDELRVERAIVVGNSLGVFVTFAFYRMFAERCSGLGIICGRSGADSAEAAASRNALAGRIEREGVAPLCETYLPGFTATEVFQRKPELAEQLRETIERTKPQGAAAVLRGMAMRVSADDLLEEVGVPVQAVAGALDPFVSVGAVRDTADLIPRAHFEVLDCGHLPQYELPDALNVALEALLVRSEKDA